MRMGLCLRLAAYDEVGGVLETEKVGVSKTGNL